MEPVAQASGVWVWATVYSHFLWLVGCTTHHQSPGSRDWEDPEVW